MHSVVLSHNSGHPTPLRLRDALAVRFRSSPPALISLDQAERELLRARPELLVVVLSPAPDRALVVLSRIKPLLGGPVLAVGPTTDPKLILRALHEGADHYLDEADVVAQLEAVLPRLHASEPAVAPRAGKLFAVLGASGGSGGSTLAVNLATVLARSGQGCALIDLCPGVNDLASLLDLKPTHTLADLCVNASRLDQAMFESALAVHPGGVHLLAPPQRYDDIRLLTPHGVNKALTLARRAFPHTVVDLEDYFHEEQLVALRQADAVVLVFRPEFTSLRNARRTLEHLGQIGVSEERVRLVVNRAGQPNELPTDEIEAALGQKIAHVVPDDPKTINASNNTGVPAVTKAPATRAAQVLVQLANSLARPGALAEAPIPPSRRASWFAFR